MPGTIAGIVLTGGASRRMGRDKALLPVGTTGCARRVASVLREVADPAVEIGRGYSDLPCVTEAFPSGPLCAVAAGARLLDAAGWVGPALVVACDLPLLAPPFLEYLARHPGTGSVLPVVDGREQPLLARWSRSDLELAVRAAADGHRSFRGLLGAATRVDEGDWAHVAPPDELSDVDTPGDVARLGLGAGWSR